jgi:hypothetical protein
VIEESARAVAENLFSSTKALSRSPVCLSQNLLAGAAIKQFLRVLGIAAFCHRHSRRAGRLLGKIRGMLLQQCRALHPGQEARADPSARMVSLGDASPWQSRLYSAAPPKLASIVAPNLPVPGLRLFLSKNSKPQLLWPRASATGEKSSDSSAGLLPGHPFVFSGDRLLFADPLAPLFSQPPQWQG